MGVLLENKHYHLWLRAAYSCGKSTETEWGINSQSQDRGHYPWGGGGGGYDLGMGICTGRCFISEAR